MSLYAVWWTTEFSQFISLKVSTTVDRGRRRVPAGGMQLPEISSLGHRPRPQFFYNLAALVWPPFHVETRDLHSQALTGLPHCLEGHILSCMLCRPSFPACWNLNSYCVPTPLGADCLLPAWALGGNLLFCSNSKPALAYLNPWTSLLSGGWITPSPIKSEALPRLFSLDTLAQP